MTQAKTKGIVKRRGRVGELNGSEVVTIFLMYKGCGYKILREYYEREVEFLQFFRRCQVARDSLSCKVIQTVCLQTSSRAKHGHAKTITAILHRCHTPTGV